MLQIQVNEKTFEVAAQNNEATVNNTAASIDFAQAGNGEFSLLFNGQSITGELLEIDKKNKLVRVQIKNQVYELAVSEPLDQLIKGLGIDKKSGSSGEVLKAPMPGMILKILVQPGDTVNKGDNLILLEAMKMENILKSPAAGTVKSVKVQEKTAVEKGAVLVEIQ